MILIKIVEDDMLDKIYNLNQRSVFFLAPTRWGKLYQLIRYIKKNGSLKTVLCSRSHKEVHSMLTYCHKENAGMCLEVFGREYTCINATVRTMMEMVKKVNPSFPISELCVKMDCPYRHFLKGKIDPQEVLVSVNRNLMGNVVGNRDQISADMIMQYSREQNLCPTEVTKSLESKVDHIATVYPYIIEENLVKKRIGWNGFANIILDEIDTLPKLQLDASTIKVPVFVPIHSNTNREINLNIQLKNQYDDIRTLISPEIFQRYSDDYHTIIELSNILNEYSLKIRNEFDSLSINIKELSDMQMHRIDEVCNKISDIEWFNKQTLGIETKKELIDLGEALYVHLLSEAISFLKKSECKIVKHINYTSDGFLYRNTYVISLYKFDPENNPYIDFSNSNHYLNERKINFLGMGATFDINNIEYILQLKWDENKIFKYNAHLPFKLNVVPKIINEQKLTSQMLLDSITNYTDIIDQNGKITYGYTSTIGKLINFLVGYNLRIWFILGRKLEYNLLQQWLKKDYDTNFKNYRYSFIDSSMDSDEIQNRITGAKKVNCPIVFFDYVSSPFARGNEWIDIDVVILTSIPLANMEFKQWEYEEIATMLNLQKSKKVMSSQDYLFTDAMMEAIQYTMRFYARDHLYTKFICIDKRLFENKKYLPIWGQDLLDYALQLNIYDEGLSLHQQKYLDEFLRLKTDTDWYKFHKHYE